MNLVIYSKLKKIIMRCDNIDIPINEQIDNFSKFRQLPPEINKTSITPLKLHKVNQFTPSVKFFC